MHAFTVHPQKSPPAKGEEKPRRRWRQWLALLLLLLGIGSVVWAGRPDPRLARAQALQKELFGPQGKNLNPDERKARFAEYREQVKHLTDDQKWELSAPMRAKQKAEMDRYFAMSPKEKNAYLDERIDRSEKARKEWEKKGAQGKGGQGKGAQPGGGFGPGAPRPAVRADEPRRRRRRSRSGGSSTSTVRPRRNGREGTNSARKWTPAAGNGAWHREPETLTPTAG